MKLLTLEINFIGTYKKIRRTLQITDDYNLNALHIAMQEMFYFNYDLEHEFEFNNKVYLPAIEHDFESLYEMQKSLTEEMQLLKDKDVDIEHLFNTKKEYLDDCVSTLASLNLSVGDSIDYTYDQENNYEFTIELKQTNPAKTSKINLSEAKGKFVPQGLDVESYNQLKQLKSGDEYQMLCDLEAEFDVKLIENNISQLEPTTTMYE